MLGLGLAGKVCSIVFFMAAAWFYIPPKNDEIVTVERQELKVKMNGHTTKDKERF